MNRGDPTLKMLDLQQGKDLNYRLEGTSLENQIYNSLILLLTIDLSILTVMEMYLMVITSLRYLDILENLIFLVS